MTTTSDALAFGVTSMVGRLRRVAVRPPSLRGDYAVAHWAQPLDLDRLADQHAQFVALLTRLGCSVEVLPPADDMPDACFVYDPAFVVGTGVIELRGAKVVRQGEPPLLATQLEDLGVPVIGRLRAPATADGGDMFWLDDSTLAIGRTYRTNRAGIDQIRAILEPSGIRVECVRHAARSRAGVLPAPDVGGLARPRAIWPSSTNDSRRWRCCRRSRNAASSASTCPEEDYESLGCNVLAVAPGVVVIAAGNDATAKALRDHGVEVHTYEASEINKGEGGPTCLTRPILRG